jgi:hypothetical protein
MSDHDSLLIGATIVAFIAGYAVVSFVINKMKAGVRSLRLGETEVDRTQREKAGLAWDTNDDANG